ncbi:lysylphosphatidylglycerol synthase transmembrane domain-containing protein [Palleronia pelagia]|nr:lysylphosphatidylglycerol synthase transmembrane domain-containing protein [Palleronia pelagia]
MARKKAFSRVRWSSRQRDRIILVACVVVVAIGLVGLVRATGWEEVRAQIAGLSPMQFVGLLALSLVNYLFRGIRWHLFARRLGLDTRFGQNLRHFLGGFAMSVTPGRVGELVRMRWIGRETGWPVERTAPLVLIDRASDLSAMGLLLALALTFSTGVIVGALPVAALAVAGAVIVTRPALLARLAIWAYGATGVLPRLFVRVRRAAQSLARFSHPATLIFASILGLIGWVAEGFSFWLLLGWMGADIDMWTAMAIFIFSTLAGGLTGAPGGIGGAEAAMIALLVARGVPLEVALPATAVIRVTTLWFAILIGLAVFPHAEARSRKGAHAVETG